MNQFIHFFEAMPSWVRSVLLIGGLALMWMAESISPLRQMKGNKLKHAGINLFFTLTTAIVNLLAAILLALLCVWIQENQFGLSYLINLPLWLFILSGILVLDLFGAWLIHFLQHQFKWMWAIHRIHHIDTEIDCTTALRHHPVESLFRVSMLFIVVFIFGLPFWMAMIYQSLSSLLAQFNHSNLKLPAWLDQGLSWIIVSPNMHKVHHSRKQAETDSNYANIFSIWDRLFGTYTFVKATGEIQYGLNEFDKKEDQRIVSLLKNPFKK